MSRTTRNPEAGVTLIEVLVVLAVIGVGAGAMMLAAGDRGGRVEAEALRLARHMTLGVDEVLMSGLPLVLDWDARGYSFGQMPSGAPQADPGAWPAAALPVLAARHDLPATVELRLRDVARPVVLPASAATQAVTFDLIGATASWTVSFDGFTARAQPGGGT